MFSVVKINSHEYERQFYFEILTFSTSLIHFPQNCNQAKKTLKKEPLKVKYDKKTTLRKVL